MNAKVPVVLEGSKSAHMGTAHTLNNQTIKSLNNRIEQNKQMNGSNGQIVYIYILRI